MSAKATAPDVQPKLNLSSEPDIVSLSPATLAYVEKLGPFQKTAPLAWKQFWSIAAGRIAAGDIAAAVALSRIDDTRAGDAAYIYQAGVLLTRKAAVAPDGLQLRELQPGKYARFLLTGPYAQLSAAYPAAFSILQTANFRLREDFCIEKYLNSPDTPEHELQTDILIPIT
jgi:DNA gyrase inhibitor GyrI